MQKNIIKTIKIVKPPSPQVLWKECLKEGRVHRFFLPHESLAGTSHALNTLCVGSCGWVNEVTGVVHSLGS